jgi:Superfamily I DNA and RNA helicases
MEKIALNPAQQQAVDTIAGPVLIIAGAGSGKTRIITSRIISLINNHGVYPSEIVALTFTNKAANEMKERIAASIARKDIPFIGTFHSYCLRLLKENISLVQAPFISIMDEDDQRKLITGILHRTNLHKSISARQASYYISQMKNKTINFNKPSAQLFDHPLMPDIYMAYEEEKRASKCLDFDDLLLQAVFLFKKHPEFKTMFQQRIRHVLVDEYQDTNVVQHELLKQMTIAHDVLAIDSICAVGDEDQSIYSWRGATVENILQFQKDFPGTSIIKVEQNYRSVQPILEVANHVIQKNRQRNPKTLWSDRPAKNRISLLTCLSEYQEAEAIGHVVTTAREHKKQASIAVLYRTHAQSRAIEELLIKKSIPYKIIGGIQFYERKEIKDLLAYITLITNPFHRTSFFRIINTPARGLGDKFEELFFEHWQDQPLMTFIDLANFLCQEKVIPPSKIKTVQAFAAIFQDLTPEDTPSTALNSILLRSEYMSYIKKTYDKEDARTRVENIQELMDAMRHFEREENATVASFLDAVTLLQEKLAATDDLQEKVLLMTLHAAKGLEFDTVIITGLEEGILPSTRSLNESNAVEEERRLFYVGITRARERLLLLNAKFRYTYGKMVDQCASQFLDELPRNLITTHDCAYWKQDTFRNFFADWFGIFNTNTASTPYTRPITIDERKQSFQSIIAHKIKTAPPAPTVSSSSEWKKNQPVSHVTFGTGLVQEVEVKKDDTIVTVNFKSGIKKIMSKFLQHV